MRKTRLENTGPRIVGLPSVGHPNVGRTLWPQQARWEKISDVNLMLQGGKADTTPRYIPSAMGRQTQVLKTQNQKVGRTASPHQNCQTRRNCAVIARKQELDTGGANEGRIHIRQTRNTEHRQRCGIYSAVNRATVVRALKTTKVVNNIATTTTRAERKKKLTSPFSHTLHHLSARDAMSV